MSDTTSNTAPNIVLNTTLDTAPDTAGHIHPLNQITSEINRIFSHMGFEVAEGPEIETEFYNFDALRIPKDHPSRDMQDTFWVKNSAQKNGENGGEKDGQKDGEKNSEKIERLLPRTHTSGVQIRYMEQNKPPFKIIVPGKVFRNEATDATHEAEFFQVEGLMVAKKVSMADLKSTLDYFFKEFFGPDSTIRFRPSYFPFVEPGVEIDVKWKDSWLEVMGGGLVHPDVLRAGGLDPEEWQGFAFGGGIDRLVMLKYGVDDIRHLYSGDLRLVNQF